LVAGWEIASLEVAGVVDQHLRFAGVRADGLERRRDRLLRRKVELDGRAGAALLFDGRLQRRRVRRLACRQHREEALFGEFLGQRAADAQADTNRQILVVKSLAVRELGVASVGLPLRRRADDDGDRLALGVGHAAASPLLLRRSWHVPGAARTVANSLRE